MKQLIFALCLVASFAQAQVSQRYAARIYRVGDQLVITDSLGNNQTVYPFTLAQIVATNSLIRVNISGLSKYYLPAKILNSSGVAYSTTSSTAAVAGIIATIPGGTTPTSANQIGGVMKTDYDTLKTSYLQKFSRRAIKPSYITVSKNNPDADFSDLQAAYNSLPSTGGTIKLDVIGLGQTRYTSNFTLSKNNVSIIADVKPMLDFNADSIANVCAIVEGTLTVTGNNFTTNNVCYSTNQNTGSGADILVFPNATIGVSVQNCAFLGKARNSLFHCLLIENPQQYDIRDIQTINNVWGVALKNSNGSASGIRGKNHNNGPVIVKADGPKTVENVNVSNINYFSTPDGSGAYYGGVYCQNFQLSSHIKNVNFSNISIKGGYFYISNVNTSDTLGLQNVNVSNLVVDNPNHTSLDHCIFFNSVRCVGEVNFSNVILKGGKTYSINDPSKSFANVRFSNIRYDKAYSVNAWFDGSFTFKKTAFPHNTSTPVFKFKYSGSAFNAIEVMAGFNSTNTVAMAINTIGGGYSSANSVQSHLRGFNITTLIYGVSVNVATNEITVTMLQTNPNSEPGTVTFNIRMLGSGGGNIFITPL